MHVDNEISHISLFIAQLILSFANENNQFTLYKQMQS